MINTLPDSLSVYTKSWLGFTMSLGAGILFFLVISILYGYGGSFEYLHFSWGSGWDAIMPHLTHLGDGAMVGGLFGLFFSKRKPELVLALFISLILVAISIAFLKQVIFADWHRPVTVLGYEKVRLLSLGKETRLSFPSGHSAAAACLGWFIATASPRQAWGFCAGIVAVLLGFTRVYIGVHFPADVAAGLGLGVLLAIAGTVSMSKFRAVLTQKSNLFQLRLFYILIGLSFVFLASGLFNTLTKYYLS